MKVLPFLEAIAFAKKQKVVLPDEYYGERIGLARAQARTISGLAGVDQIQSVFDKLDAVLNDGGTFRDFQKSVADGTLDVGLPKHRLELVFRNNIQTAYAAGRWQQVQANKENRPYLQYVAINDGRTRPSHARMNGHIAAVDDPWWTTHAPLNGYRCRCSQVSLTEAQAKKKGIKPASKAEPDQGWDYNPGEAPMQGLKQAAEHKKQTVHPKLAGVVDRAVANDGRPTTPQEAKDIGAAIRAHIESKGESVTLDSIYQELKARRSFDKVLANTSGGGKGVKSIKAVSVRYPDDWVKTSNDKGVTHAMYSGMLRGWHVIMTDKHDGKRVRLGGGFGIRTVKAGDSYIVTDGDKTSTHEFAHRLQSTIDGLDAIFQTEHRARTSADKLERLRELTGNKGYGNSEVAKKDHYVAPYFGREYGNGDAKEVMTMAFQHVLGGNKSEFDTLLAKDKALFDLTIGLLAAF